MSLVYPVAGIGVGLLVVGLILLPPQVDSETKSKGLTRIYVIDELHCDAQYVKMLDGYITDPRYSLHPYIDIPHTIECLEGYHDLWITDLLRSLREEHPRDRIIFVADIYPTMRSPEGELVLNDSVQRWNFEVMYAENTDGDIKQAAALIFTEEGWAITAGHPRQLQESVFYTYQCLGIQEKQPWCRD